MTQIIHQPHDKFFKSSMTDIRVAKDFFEAYIPSEILQKIDLGSLKLEKETFVDANYQASEADVIYSVQIGNSLGYLYVLCEHQSEVDNYMAFRLFGYILRILETFHKQSASLPLPVVYPLVVYTGKKSWIVSRDFFELFGEHSTLAKTDIFKPFSVD